MQITTAIKIAKEYLPDVTDDDLNCIIWGRTGFPSFWDVPKDGNTPEECFRKQFEKIKEDYKMWKKSKEIVK